MPGLFTLAHPSPQDTTPVKYPSQTSGPPESPCNNICRENNVKETKYFNILSYSMWLLNESPLNHDSAHE
jgi:hypothetical protein